MSPPSKTACKDGADPIQVPSVILEDEDAESGNGPSLPMSPRSVEAIPAATASSETRGGVTPVKQVLYQALFLCNTIKFYILGQKIRRWAVFFSSYLASPSLPSRQHLTAAQHQLPTV